MDREAMWKVLEIYRVDRKGFYEQSSPCVRVAGNMSSSFKVNKALRQECGISSWLFNTYMDGLVYKRGLQKDAEERNQNVLPRSETVAFQPFAICGRYVAGI